MHRHRLLLGIATLLAAGPAAAQPVAVCRIDGYAAILAARSGGFVFASVDTDASECQLDNASIVVSAPQSRSARCRLRLFGGQALEPGWTLSRVVIEFTPQAAQAEVGPAGSATAGRMLSLTVPKGRTGLFTVRRVVLRGPDCDHWKDAFR